jgi:hypothetical protein
VLPIWLFWLLPFCSTLQTATQKTEESGVVVFLPTGPQSPKNAETAETAIRFGPRSAWSASTRSGRSLAGTWTGAIDLSTGTASGTWTVRDSAGRIAMGGTWSAAKEGREWRGTWRALIAGQTKEQSGSWTAALDLPPDSQLGSMFSQAVQQAVSGAWQSGGQSGGWSIRAVR